MTKEEDASAISAERWIAILRYRGMDAEALLVAQRRNLKALMQASEVVAKGLDEATSRQAGLVRQSLSRLGNATPTIEGSSNFGELARQQLDYSRQAVEAALTHFQELSDLVWRCNRDACEVINHSLFETLQSFVAAMPEEAATPKPVKKNETSDRKTEAKAAPAGVKVKTAARGKAPRRKG